MHLELEKLTCILYNLPFLPAVLAIPQKFEMSGLTPHNLAIDVLQNSWFKA